MANAAYWEKLEGSGAASGEIRCLLCPHGCRLKPGQTGICKVRRNGAGEMCLPFYGKLSALALDPIEKKPLHHFKPGTKVLSAGFFGCNLACPFCQNWSISQETEEDAAAVMPAGLVAEALKAGSPSLAFTYSEPTVHFEYILEAATLAQEAGLATVLVTNGCLNEAPARELLPHIDAANIDLKCASAEGYARVLKGDLAAVKAFIALAAETSAVEVTTLAVPGFSDGAEEMADIAAFIASIDPDIPLHISAYHPAFRYSAPPTETGLVLRLAEVARAKLRYVYAGNLGGFPADTGCASCGSLLVRRRGYSIDASGLEPDDRKEVGRHIAQGAVQGATPRSSPSRCARCKAPSPIRI
jgi:pyruvate formate lyase activating enzyme